MRQPLVSTSRGEVPPRPLLLRKTGLRSRRSKGEPEARAPERNPARAQQQAGQRLAHLSVTLRVHISKGEPEARASKRNLARAHIKGRARGWRI